MTETTNATSARSEPNGLQVAPYPQLLGLAPLATVIANADQRVTHWNSWAHRLFGRTPAQATGQLLDDALPIPAECPALLQAAGDRDGPCSAGLCSISRPDGTIVEAAWWGYPLTGPGTSRLLLLAADAASLREHVPGLAIGDHTVMRPGAAYPPEIDLSVSWLQPVTVKIPGPEAERFRRTATEFLPLDDPGANKRVIDQVLGLGYPALDVSLTARLPYLPHAPAAHLPPQPTAGAEDADPAEASVLELAAARARLTFLNEASARIGRTLDMGRTATELSEAVMPRFADFVSVHLLDQIVAGDELPEQISPLPMTSLRRMAMMHDYEPGAWERILPVGEVVQFSAEGPFVQSISSGNTINVSRVDRSLADAISHSMSTLESSVELWPLIRDSALLVAPLTARGAVFGDIVLMRKPGRPPFDDAEVAVAEELAHRTALSLDNARLYRRESCVAEELQRSMLPRTPPELPDVDVAYRYLPSGKAQVGGDWFDAIPLPNGRVALVVGDVMGHGIRSAAAMGQLRTAVHTLAALDLPPDQVLRKLDDLAQRLGESYLATCVYIVYDPVKQYCHAANAGHISPVIIDPDGESLLLDLPAGAPIGVGDVLFETVGFDAPAGSQLALCTDGLIEVRGQDIGRGLADLCAGLAGASRTIEQACDAITRALHTEDRQDDVALLMARFHGTAGSSA